MNLHWNMLASFYFSHLWQILLVFVLLGCSAFFSGSETAFFHLPKGLVKQFSQSELRIERLVSELLSNPNRLLTALLFGNMLVNVLYFAMTSMLSIQIGRSSGPLLGTFTATTAFALLVLIGEMLPKSLAYANTKTFSLIAAPACYMLIRVLGPLLGALDFFLILPVINLFVKKGKKTEFSVNQLKLLLESTKRQGLITSDESQLLTEILKFSFLKVRHVMQPRVEMPACPLSMPVEKVKKKMLDGKIIKMPVYTTSIDSMAGYVHLRDIFLYPNRPLAEMVQNVDYVPEQKTVESLIDFFRRTKTDMAVVVDEYGGVAGRVDLEDIIEHLLGAQEESSEYEPIEQIGPMKYRLQANLSMHDWMETFGIEARQERQTTIGGFVIALLGKIPKEGDEVSFQNIKFTIETIRHNRIGTIILSLQPIIDGKE